MFGILNLDKPGGMTSRDIVNQVQRIVTPIKVGHAGTLDPLATGVLVVCLGPATRLVEYIQQLPKIYRATFVLGCHSDTEDIDGLVESLTAPRIPSDSEVQRVLPEFQGTIAQRPPQYSALKVNGKRAYALARQGRTVDLKPRLIHIDHIELVEYEYPELTVLVRCGSGTYVRSLGRDIAERMGTAAVMKSLTREAIGPFTIADAVSTAHLQGNDLKRHVIPAGRAVEHLPRLDLNDEELTEIQHGRTIASPPGNLASPIAAFSAQTGDLAAILRRRADGRLGPARNFIQASSAN